MPTIELTLEPEGRILQVEPGHPVQDILAAAEVIFSHPCGGRATCGHCRIRYLDGATEPTVPERKILSSGELDEGLRLSCCSRPESDCRIRLMGAPSREAAFELGPSDTVEIEIVQDVARLSLRIEPPSLETPTDLLERFLEQLRINGASFDSGLPDIPVSILQHLPQAVQAGKGMVTVTFDPAGWISVQPGGRHDELFGLAVDVGTTTLAARLVHLVTGEAAEQDIRLNGQVAWGADVVCRIDHCRSFPDGLAQLRDRVRQDLNDMTEALLRQQGIPRESVARAAVAGNPTMMHLLLGVDPASIAQAPYVPVWTELLQVPASEVGLPLAPGAYALLAPSLSGYIGGDVLCGILVSGMDESDATSLLIDVGTNGEIVLHHKGRMAAAAAAAGPAFEGAQISCGTWAARGAIHRVEAERDGLRVETLGDRPPIGLCGTGLVDITALLVRQGVVDGSGRMLPSDRLDAVPEYLKKRMQLVQGHPAFHLEQTEDGQPIHLLARDVRQVQLAKGAIQAGVAILCRELNVAMEAIDRVYLAGSFGRNLIVENLQRLGLLHGVAPEKVLPIGNSSLAGAQMLLLSERQRARLETLRQRIHYIELSGYEGFTDIFAEALPFPDA